MKKVLKLLWNIGGIGSFLYYLVTTEEFKREEGESLRVYIICTILAFLITLVVQPVLIPGIIRKDNEE